MIAGQPTAHESAHLHVSGEALYCRRHPAAAEHAARRVRHEHAWRMAASARIDLDAGAQPRRASSRVVTAADIPGENNYGAVVHDDPIFADGLVQYAGQPLFAVAATSYDAARRAARTGARRVRGAARDPRHPRGARSGELRPARRRRVARGEPRGALAARAASPAGHRSTIGGQDHFYLEGQIAVAIPQEDGGMLVHSSTQHPTEVQHIVAHALGVHCARRHRAMPAHGRRLRRQGEPGGADRLPPRRCSRARPGGR